MKISHRFYVAIIALCLLVSGCASKSLPLPPIAKHADVVLEVTPLQVKDFNIGDTVDVIETLPSEAKLSLAKILFRVDKVLMGEFIHYKVGGPSEWVQAQSAVRARNIWKLLTLDFSDPDELKEKRWVTVAVVDPEERFRIKSWEDPPNRKMKLYLKRVPKNPDSYVMLDVQF